MTQTGSRTKAWTLFIMIMAVSWHSQAQDVALRGFVKDSAAQTPLNNASITIKGLRGGARSNADGRFRIVGLLPGLPARVTFASVETEPFVPPKRYRPDRLQKMTLESGEARDLGDVEARPDPR